MENLDKVYAKRIAEEYAPKTTTKVVQLKKLDQKVKRPANIFAFTFGTISALIAGAGMSMIMTDFGFSGTTGIVLGIILGAGASNVLDRFIHGGVVDYVFWHKWFNFAVFNFADVMINLGVVIILLRLLIKK